MALQNFGPTMFPVEVCTARAASDCVVEYYAEKPPVSIGEPIELCCAPRLPRPPSGAVKGLAAVFVNSHSISPNAEHEKPSVDPSPAKGCYFAYNQQPETQIMRRNIHLT